MDTKAIQVRRATLDDLTTIVSYNQAMAIETEDKQLDDGVVRCGVEAALNDPTKCTYYIAELAGEPVGQTMTTVEWSDWRNGFFWWIQSVYVVKKARRQGVFRALYNHVRSEAKNQPDVCGLRLYVFHENRRAIETYETLGMTVADYKICEEIWPSGA